MGEIMAGRVGLKFVAVLEATKGALVLAVGLGVFEMLHRDIQAGAERLVRNMHLNPASHYPQVFIEAMRRLDRPHLRLLALGALAYALVRFIEALGLWGARRWAEWFGALSGSIYLPLEIYNLGEGVTWPRVTVLMVNLIVVGYLVVVLARSRVESGNSTAV
jgi:uncharacterized membrane protein (DUF2068 family)